jgi:hypothetical protein
MKCPMCKDVDLLITERHGVEIDQCPICCGIWFDRRVHWTDSSQDRCRPGRPAASIPNEDVGGRLISARKQTTARDFREGPHADAGPPKGP